MHEKTLEETFEELADHWQRETWMLSNSETAARHPAHQAIVRMGEPGVGLILKRMQDRGGHWFSALHQIAGARPIPRCDRGRILRMTEAWLKWGRKNGYLEVPDLEETDLEETDLCSGTRLTT